MSFSSQEAYQRRLEEQRRKDPRWLKEEAEWKAKWAADDAARRLAEAINRVPYDLKFLALRDSWGN